MTIRQGHSNWSFDHWRSNSVASSFAYKHNYLSIRLTDSRTPFDGHAIAQSNDLSSGRSAAMFSLLATCSTIIRHDRLFSPFCSVCQLDLHSTDARLF
jgi:hypothetical protein